MSSVVTQQSEGCSNTTCVNQLGSLWSIGSITPEEAGEVFDAGTRNTHSQNIEQDGAITEMS